MPEEPKDAVCGIVADVYGSLKNTPSMQETARGTKLCNLDVDMGGWSISVVCEEGLAEEAAKHFQGDSVSAKGKLIRTVTRSKGISTPIYHLQASELCPRN